MQVGHLSMAEREQRLPVQVAVRTVIGVIVFANVSSGRGKRSRTVSGYANLSIKAAGRSPLSWTLTRRVVASHHGQGHARRRLPGWRSRQRQARGFEPGSDPGSRQTTIAGQPIGGAVARLVMEPSLRIAPVCLPVSLASSGHRTS